MLSEKCSYISDRGFNFHSSVCNGCHDVSLVSIDSFTDIASITSINSDY